MVDDEVANGKLMSLRGRCQKHSGGQYENGTKHESSLHGWTFACEHTRQGVGRMGLTKGSGWNRMSGVRGSSRGLRAGQGRFG